MYRFNAPSYPIDDNKKHGTSSKLKIEEQSIQKILKLAPTASAELNRERYNQCSN